MRKILLILAALFALAACGNKQADAPASAGSETITNDTISKETMQHNMQEVQAYLKECGAFFIATSDGDQPRVRPFGVSEIINDRLTGAVTEEDGYDHLDIRDTRADWFFGLPAGRSKTFSIGLRAAYEGSFVMPATVCQAMYEPAITASTPDGVAVVNAH